MVENNIPLVGYLVNKVMAGATNLSREDLAQAGCIALIQAVDSFEPERGIPFGAYARERIIGGIKDEMRANDWAKRTTRTQIKATLSVLESLAADLGRDATVGELAGALGVSREAAGEAMALSSRRVVGVEQFVEVLAADIVLPGEDILVEERLTILRTAIESLPEKLRFIVQEVYLNDRPVGDVADELGVTHSAVSQQRTEAVRLLRAGFEKFYPDGDNMFGDEEPEAAKRPSPRRTEYLSTLADKLTANLRMPAMAL
ncbi:sigma-70 family RNA polymerase sigma factor [Leifsonia sp. Leaf264]|uniref:sigma-70 family RNA polymerase sigma factor n=1 Tax=Leifsonia sp. Leaf264 TaxID=1736314 RepID=UPI0009EBAF70|nr:sigma-70 family RNA polymerase sigma factor [Leifsonia sp. Leaf264]